MDMQFREISCQKANTLKDFGVGVQDYNFNVGGATVWYPSKSYFRVKMRITAPGDVNPAGTQPSIQDEVALADNVVGNLFDNIYFRGGGQDISSIVSYASQASILRQRLTKSGAWLNSMGKDVFSLDSDYNSRVNRIAFNTDPVDESQYERINLGTQAHRLDYTIAFTDAGVFTGANTNFLGTANPEVPITGTAAAVPLLRPGDFFLIQTPNGFTKVYVLTVDNNIRGTYAPDLAGDIGAAEGIYAYRGEAGTKRNTITSLWRPPIGIFDSDKPMGAGDYRISLNPNSRYKTSAIESIANLTPSEAAVAGTFNFEVLDMKLYICLAKDTVQQSGIDQLFLSEQHLQSKPITGIENSLDFTVPPSTKMLAFFIQSGIAGSDTRIPPSKFKSLCDYDMSLESFQITYANQSKPSTRWTSNYTDTENSIQQRFYDTYSECGLANLQGGTESLSDFIKRGCVYVYRFDRDSTDKSTQVQIQLKVRNLEPSSNLILCAFYTRTCEVSYTNGMITEVRSLNV